MKKIYKNFIALTALILMLFNSASYAQIATWHTIGINDTTTPLLVAGTDFNLDATSVSIGDGLIRTTLGNAFSTSPKAATTNDDTGEQTAITNGDYFEFSVNSKNNYTLSIEDIAFKMRVSNTTRWFLLRYKIGAGAFQSAGARIAFTGSASGNGVVQTIDVSTITALKDIPSGTIVTFRIYHGGANNTSSTTAIGRSLSNLEAALSVNGNVKPTTAPTSILAWQLFNPQSVGSETAIDANVKNTGLETSSLVRGAGLRSKNNSNVDITYPGSFVAGATVATAVAATTDIADAITNNLYFGFQVKPSANYKASLSTLRSKIRASGGGAKTWLWRYSIDGTNFNDLGTVYYNAGTAVAGVNMPDVDLSGIAALQNLTPSTMVYFRLYVQGSNATTGSTGLGISSDENTYAISLNGTVESTLPVKLTKFTGENNGRHVRLNWATASERQNAYFEVLRIQKDKTPINLGKVLGSGNSEVTKNYSFIDYNPQSGTNYYQLRQVDQNGDFELSEIIPVKVSLSSSELLTFFKNDLLNLSFETENAGVVDLKLVDISGRVVYKATIRSQAGKNDIQVPAEVNKGVYVVSLSGDKISISKKIIK
mgnify:CR=1 FL=1